MKQITLCIDDEQTVTVLLNYLAELDHIHDVDVVELNGPNGSRTNDTRQCVSMLYQDPRQPQMDKEVAAFEEQHRQLVDQYLGQYIAMHGSEVVDHDADELVLSKRIKSKYGNKVVLVRQVQETLPGPLYFRSHRIVN